MPVLCRTGDFRFVLKFIEMIYRAVAGANFLVYGVRNGGGDVGFGVLNGGDYILTVGQIGGDGGGKCASGAVGVVGLDALGRKPDFLMGVFEQIVAVFPGAVPAFDDHVFGAHF